MSSINPNITQLVDDLSAHANCSGLLKTWIDARGEFVVPRKSAIEAILSEDRAAKTGVSEVRAPDRVIVVRDIQQAAQLTGLKRLGMNVIEYTRPGFRELRSKEYFLTAFRPTACAFLRNEPDLRYSNVFYNCQFVSLPVLPDNDDDPMMIYFGMDLAGDLHSDVFLQQVPEHTATSLWPPLSMSRYDLGYGLDAVELPAVDPDKHWPASKRHYMI